MLWAGLIMGDGCEAGWPGYERHPGEDTGEEDQYRFEWRNFPGGPAPVRVAIFAHRRGGRIIGVCPFNSDPGRIKRGSTLELVWRVRIPTVETPRHERLLP